MITGIVIQHCWTSNRVWVNMETGYDSEFTKRGQFWRSYHRPPLKPIAPLPPPQKQRSGYAPAIQLQIRIAFNPVPINIILSICWTLFTLHRIFQQGIKGVTTFGTLIWTDDARSNDTNRTLFSRSNARSNKTSNSLCLTLKTVSGRDNVGVIRYCIFFL